MGKYLLIILLALSSVSLAQVCKSNQYDMLEWIAPQGGVVNGHFNVVYPVAGKFYWIKSNKGYPWDVDTFDRNFIYQVITEQVWDDPHTYKRFHKPMPWMQRCIDIPTSPGKLSTINILAKDTDFDIHTSCSSFTTHNLGNVINEIWGPDKQSFGGKLEETSTLTLSYRYGCNVLFSSCKYRETFQMQKPYGLVKWTYYINNNGQWVQQGETVDNDYHQGTIQPMHPCF